MVNGFTAKQNADLSYSIVSSVIPAKTNEESTVENRDTSTSTSVEVTEREEMVEEYVCQKEK